MPTYSGHANRPDRAKAAAAVVAVHVALAAIIATGLNIDKVRTAVDQLKTFDVTEVPPPPPPPPAPQPRPAPKAQKAKEAPAPPAPKAQPAPVVAPPAKIPVPSPVRAAKVAGTGSASASGAANRGAGTGAGGTGNGTGGGGTGNGGGGMDYSRFTPARLVMNIPSSEYRQLASTGLPSGLVGVTIRVNTDGSVGNCRVARSSGDSGLDGLVCQLTQRYVRFDPARDPSGRPVAQDITYFPNWRRR